MFGVVPPIGIATAAGDWIGNARSANVAAIAAARDRIGRTIPSEVATTNVATVTTQVATVSATSDRIRWAVPNVIAVSASNIGVTIEVVEVVDRDVVAAPSASPAPTATPKCPHGDANSK